MKQLLFGFILLFLSVSTLRVKSQTTENKKFRLFSRAEISYLCGIKDVYADEKINSLHVKLVIGTANPITGIGIGLENASYRTAGGSGPSFETLNFSANAHFLAKPIYTDELNFFIKGAVGYAPKIFRGYNNGHNYEIAPGILFTTKRKSKYFLQAVYQFQEIAGFMVDNQRPKIKGVGLGVGTWF